MKKTILETNDPGVDIRVSDDLKDCCVSGLKPVLGFRDLVLFYLIVIFSIRMVPLVAFHRSKCRYTLVYCPAFVFCTNGLDRHGSIVPVSPGRGDYTRSRIAFGNFHGFMTGQTYWTANLVFFPHVVGFKTATWFHNVSALACFLTVFVLIALGLLSQLKFGSATDFSFFAWIPNLSNIKAFVFISTLLYMLVGIESASVMQEEVLNPRKNTPRAILTGDVLIISRYIFASLALWQPCPLRN